METWAASSRAATTGSAEMAGKTVEDGRTRAGYARSDACGEPSAGLSVEVGETQLVEAGTNLCAHLRTRKVAGTYG